MKEYSLDEKVKNVELPIANMSFEEFRNDILDSIKAYPKDWRYGQKVFNCVDAKYYGVARNVQFIHNIDCFYNDDLVEAFLKCAFKEYEIKCKA